MYSTALYFIWDVAQLAADWPRRKMAIQQRSPEIVE